MFAKSPERLLRYGSNDPKKMSSGVGGSNSWQVQVAGEKRLKSLELRTNIQSKQLQPYQAYSKTSTVSFSGNFAGQEQNKATGLGIANGATETDWQQKGNADSKVKEVIPVYSMAQEQQQQGSSIANFSSISSKKSLSTMQVYIRVRPLNGKELEGKNFGRRMLKVIPEQHCVVVSSADSIPNLANDLIGLGKSGVREDKVFEMNGVFGETSTNEDLFNIVMKSDIRDSLFEGFNCTCFVYGMTGAGKTYTMFGDIAGFFAPGESETVHGIIILALREMLSVAAEKRPKVKLSFLEIYNESIRDLLSSEVSENLMVVEDTQKGVFVPGLIEKEVQFETDVTELIRLGNTRRQMAPTRQNDFSSRSHAILTFSLEQTNKKPDESNPSNGNITVQTSSKLCLVDLAGSERAAVTENRGMRLVEGANINRSLLALGNCINILSDTSKKGAFVPYRDSKLTRLLKDSLGGNTKTYMIACVSPAQISLDETLNTLKYAQRARRIQKTLTKNIKSLLPFLSSSNSEHYLQIIDTMKNEIQSLKAQLASQQKPGLMPAMITLNQLQAANQSQFANNANKKQMLAINPNQFAAGSFLKQKKISRLEEDYPQEFQDFLKAKQDDEKEEYILDKFSEQENFQDQDLEGNIQNNNNNIIWDLSKSTNFNNNGNQLDTNTPLTQSIVGVQNAMPTMMSQESNGSNIPGGPEWEHESFSSSGKSIRISCSNASSSGSVILFKRSPSQLNFLKQQEINQQRTTELLEGLSAKILKNLEENWEIQQSIADLNGLRRQNEEIMGQKEAQLAALKTKLLQWPHESERTELVSQIAQLKETMKSNEAVFQGLNEALQRNDQSKQEFNKEMTNLLAESSENMAKQFTQTCQALQAEKNDLENANIEMKQQNQRFHSQFRSKLSQIKSMEEQIKLMNKQLQEKNDIIERNQQIISHLSILPNNSTVNNSAAVNSAHSIQSNVTSPAALSKSSTTINGLRFLNMNQNQVDSRIGYSHSNLKTPSQPQQNLAFSQITPFTQQTVSSIPSFNPGASFFMPKSTTGNATAATAAISNSSTSGGNGSTGSGTNQGVRLINHAYGQSEPRNMLVHPVGQHKTTQSLGGNLDEKGGLYPGQYPETAQNRQTSAEANRATSGNASQATIAGASNSNTNTGSFLFQQFSTQSAILRSTSSQNTAAKKFILERSGYFDFKNKQQQQQQQQQQYQSQNQNQYQPLQQQQQSKPVVQEKVQAAAPKSEIPFQKSNGGMQPPTIIVSQATPSSSSLSAAVSKPFAVPQSRVLGQPHLHYQTFSSPGSQSSARLSTMYKTVQAHIPSQSALSNSSINKNSIQTHRDKQQQQQLQQQQQQQQSQQKQLSGLESSSTAALQSASAFKSTSNLSSSSFNHRNSIGVNKGVPGTQQQQQPRLSRSPATFYKNPSSSINNYVNQQAGQNFALKKDDILNNESEIFESSGNNANEFPKNYYNNQDPKMFGFTNNNNNNNGFEMDDSNFETQLNRQNQDSSKSAENARKDFKEFMSLFRQIRKEEGEEPIEEAAVEGESPPSHIQNTSMLHDFLKTEEFGGISKSAQQSPERGLAQVNKFTATTAMDSMSLRRNSLTKFNISPVLTASSLHQAPLLFSNVLSNSSQQPYPLQPQQPPQSAAISPSPFSSFSESQVMKEPAEQYGIGETVSASQKESNIVTPERSSVSIHKIDLYKEKDRPSYSPNAHSLWKNNSSNSSNVNTNNNILEELTKLDSLLATQQSGVIPLELNNRINDVVGRLSTPQYPEQSIILNPSQRSALARLQDAQGRSRRLESPPVSYVNLLPSNRAKSQAKGMFSDSNQTGGNSNQPNGTHATTVKYQSLSPSKKITSQDNNNNNNPVYSQTQPQQLQQQQQQQNQFLHNSESQKFKKLPDYDRHYPVINLPMSIGSQQLSVPPGNDQIGFASRNQVASPSRQENSSHSNTNTPANKNELNYTKPSSGGIATTTTTTAAAPLSSSQVPTAFSALKNNQMSNNNNVIQINLYQNKAYTSSIHTQSSVTTGATSPGNELGQIETSNPQGSNYASAGNNLASNKPTFNLYSKQYLSKS